MKIVHIGPSGLSVRSQHGGAVQRRMMELAREQVRQHHEVTVLSPENQPSVVTEDAGVSIVSVPLVSARPLRDYEYFARARRALRGQRFDVLHAHGSPDARRALGRLGDVSVQTVDFFRYRLTSQPWGHRYYQSSLNKYDAIMPVSDFCAREFVRFYPGLRPRIVTVPNGVDVEQFRLQPWAGDEARHELGLPPGQLVIYLGRVCRQKGSDLLVPLSRSLSETAPGVRVVAVGPPEQFGTPGRSELMEKLDAAGVLCTGAVHERLLCGVLNAASVCVLPTREDEMFGMAALEALACGTPVVASDLGGIPQAVGDAGRLFPVGDSEAFAAAVREALVDAEVARAGDKARSHALRFSWAEIESATADVYQVARGRRP